MTDELNIKIRRQNRRSMMMRPIPGGAEVFIPHYFDEHDKEVQTFIKKALKKLEKHMKDLPPEKTSRTQIMKFVEDYAQKMGVQASRVQMRDMTRKWGSCSSKGTITLNTRLMWLEPPIAEYVVCHELAHLIELNHSKKFWSLVEKHMPDYLQRLDALRVAEKGLW